MNKTCSCVISPNARIIAETLRNTGIKNDKAICDILDNSIDANAEEIYVNFTFNEGKLTKGVKTIEIVDNGCGMDFETLKEAMRFGSDTNKKNDKRKMLGCYGMGLNTASTSIGKQFEVITKTKGGEIYYSLYNVDEIIAKNKFIIKIATIEWESLQDFVSEETLSVVDNEHFTIVKISEIDRLKQWNHQGMKKSFSNLRESVGRTYRRFLKEGECNIYIDGILVNVKDPLFGEEHYQVLMDKNVEIDSGKFLNIKAIKVLDENNEDFKPVPDGQKYRGIYWMRNGREIKHENKFEFNGASRNGNSVNRIRAEINYSGEDFDNLFSTSFTKQDIEVPENILEVLYKKYGFQKLLAKAQEEYNSARKRVMKKVEKGEISKKCAKDYGIVTGAVKPEPKKKSPKKMTVQEMITCACGNMAFKVYKSGEAMKAECMSCKTSIQNF